MVKESKTKVEKDAKKGKSRKERTGMPQVDVVSAIKFIKSAYENVGIALKSFSGMTEAMGVSKAHGKKAFGELRNYGLLEQEGFGWRISDLGRRVAQDDKNAVIEVVMNDKILGNLYENLKDKVVDRDYIEDFIKKKRYAYNLNTKIVSERFLGIMNHINGLGSVSASGAAVSDGRNLKKWFKVIQLKYALNPKKEDIPKLAEAVAEEFENDENLTLKTLAKSIKDNKGNNQVLQVLVDNLITIAREYTPIEILEVDAKSEKKDLSSPVVNDA